jgi:hypothetical protein
MMRRFAAAVVLLVVGAAAFGQERATTESGKAVILHPNGTWEVAPLAQKDRPVEPSTHVRSARATDKAELKRTGYQLYYDPQKWKQVNGETGRVSFNHANGDGYGLVLTERIVVPLENMRNIALSNATSAAPDAKITFEETRVVNGTKLLCLQIKGTIQNISFIYFGYYYSGKEGTVQILTYTAANLFDEYKGDFEEFLNGFVLDGGSGA